MELKPSFAEAFIHRLQSPFRPDDPWSGHRIAGRRLRPLSLWHLLLLRQIESPLLVNPAAMGGEDLLRVVSICRCRFPDMDARARWTPMALWSLRKGGLERERIALLEYVEDFLQRPDYSVATIGRPGRTLRLGPPPEIAAVASAVIFATGWPERAVWEMAVGAAYWYEALARRQREPIDFLTAEERAFQEEMEAAGIRPWEPKAAPDDSGEEEDDA